MELKNAIEIGRRVSTGLYGRGRGTIVAVYGAPGQDPVRALGGGVVMMGGSCEVDIVFDGGQSTKRLPECILRGVQWTVLDEVVDGTAIAQALASAAIYDAQMKAKAEAVASAFTAAMAASLKAGTDLGLIPEADFRAAGKRGSAAAWNLRQELKKAGIKASVKQDGYTCINVRIENADQAELAKTIAQKYKAGSFDGMTDCYDYDPSAWGSVFGDVRYVFVTKPNGCMV